MARRSRRFCAAAFSLQPLAFCIISLVPPYALQLVIALALAGLTFFVAYPLAVGEGRSVDVLDASLLVLALVNLRLAWSAANGANGGRAPAWFVAAGLGTAALIATAMIGALTPR